MPARKVCEILAQNNVTPHPLVCFIGGALFGDLRHLQAGEYEIPQKASFLEVLTKISHGDVIVYQINFPEGLTSYEIVERLKTLPKVEGDIQDIPQDGTLFPATYAYKKGETRAALIQKMMSQMEKLSQDLWTSRPAASALTSREEMLILASLIEKEAALPHEREIVSAVFHNRLKIGMRLQCDPTVVYAISDGKGQMDRDLNRADLQKDHPFNTYLNAGLPPSPIANPGLAAMKAALNPANVTYLYFVADGTGGHQFSTILQDHQKNHRAWRQVRDQKK